MEGIKLIKKELGFSNHQLAIYLGVSKALITLVLKGERSLSSEANILMARLLVALQEISPVVDVPVENKNLLNTKLLRQISEVDFRLKKLQERYNKITVQYRQAIKLQRVAALLQQNPLPGLDATKERLWVNAQLAKAATAQKNGTWDKQKFMQIQLEILLYAKERLMAYKQSLI